jgi:shikimate dehydrogenase
MRADYNQRVSGPFAQPINASTRFCAVFGHPVRHSASPAMQNAGIAALGLNWRYLAFEVQPEKLRAAIDGAKAMHFIGVNLTVPHKLLAVEMADALDASAKMFGAGNTIRFEGRGPGKVWKPLREFGDATPLEIRSHGFNTDADAITRSLREDLDLELRGAKILLLGTGGAGRVAALQLAGENVAGLFLVNRTQSKAEAIAKEIRQRNPGVKVTIGYPKNAVDLVLNATSLGLNSKDALPFDGKKFTLRNARAAYDMIYRPAETPFLRAAKSSGCRTANGIGMLLHQGARALELWTGKSAPLEIMRRALEKEVYSPQSTVHSPQS